MRRALQPGLVVVFALAFGPAYGQLTEVFCPNLDAIPPRPEAKCSDDNLSLIFDSTCTNELVLDPFVAGMQIPCKVFMDTVSMTVQGWSYSRVEDLAGDAARRGCRVPERLARATRFREVDSPKSICGEVPRPGIRAAVMRAARRSKRVALSTINCSSRASRFSLTAFLSYSGLPEHLPKNCSFTRGSEAFRVEFSGFYLLWAHFCLV